MYKQLGNLSARLHNQSLIPRKLRIPLCDESVAGLATRTAAIVLLTPPLSRNPGQQAAPARQRLQLGTVPQPLSLKRFLALGALDREEKPSIGPNIMV